MITDSNGQRWIRCYGCNMLLMVDIVDGDDVVQSHICGHMNCDQCIRRGGPEEQTKCCGLMSAVREQLDESE